MSCTDYWHVPVTNIDAYDPLQHNHKLLHFNATCSLSCPYVTVIPEEWESEVFTVCLWYQKQPNALYTDYWHVPVTDIDAYDLTNT